MDETVIKYSKMVVDRLQKEMDELHRIIAGQREKIKSLKKENERLEYAFVAECELSACPRKKEIRGETAREIGERLKNSDVYLRVVFPNTDLAYRIFVNVADEIDKLVEEMVGDGNE